MTVKDLLRKNTGLSSSNVVSVAEPERSTATLKATKVLLVAGNYQREHPLLKEMMKLPQSQREKITLVEIAQKCQLESNTQTALIPACHRKELILEALDGLLEAIRERSPGIHNRKARKLRSRFARSLNLYFRKLGRNIPYRDLPGYLDRNAVREAVTPDDEAIRLAANATDAMNQELNSILRKNIEDGYLLGATQAHQLYRIEPTFDLLDDGAVQWMNNRSAQLVTKIDQVTRERLSATLARGARAGDSVPRLARRIRAEVKSMADISKGRAHLIANTELNEAMSEAGLQTYTRLNIKGKSWSTVGDDRVSDDCRANQGAGIIPLAQIFPGGVGRPPQHPGCRCTLVPERMGAPAPTGLGL